MSTKQVKKLKELSKSELALKSKELEASLFEIKLKHSTGQLENTAMVWKTRKELARVKTLLGANGK